MTDFYSFSPAYETILEHAKTLVKNNRDDELIVTGHSLGGLLASIVTARLKLDQKMKTIPTVPIRSIVFAAPGVYYNNYGFGFDDILDIQRLLINVVSDHDLVPKVDYQVGNTQRINCKHESPGKCHKLEHYTCELWRACGDPKGRDYREGCKDWIHKDDLPMISECQFCW